MARTFWLHNAVNTPTVSVTETTHTLSTSDPTDGTDNAPALKKGGTKSIYYIQNEDTGETKTSTGTFTVEVNISTIDASCVLNIQLHRVNSSGTIQASSGYSTNIDGGTSGLHSRNFVDPALGTWASTDRLAVEVRNTNNNTTSNNLSPVWDTGTANSEVSTPFTASTATNYTRDVTDQMFMDEAEVSDMLRTRLTAEQLLMRSPTAFDIDHELTHPFEDVLLYEAATRHSIDMTSTDLLLLLSSSVVDAGGAVEEVRNVLDSLFLLSTESRSQEITRLNQDNIFLRLQTTLDRSVSRLDSLLLSVLAERDRSLLLRDRALVGDSATTEVAGAPVERTATDNIFLYDSGLVDTGAQISERTTTDNLFVDVAALRQEHNSGHDADPLFVDSPALEQEHDILFDSDKLLLLPLSAFFESEINRAALDNLFLNSVAEIVSGAEQTRNILDGLLMSSSVTREMPLTKIDSVLLRVVSTFEHAKELRDSLPLGDPRQIIIERYMIDRALLSSQLLDRVRDVLQRSALLVGDQQTITRDARFLDAMLLDSTVSVLAEGVAITRAVIDYLFLHVPAFRQTHAMSHDADTLLLNTLSALDAGGILRAVVDYLFLHTPALETEHDLIYLPEGLALASIADLISTAAILRQVLDGLMLYDSSDLTSTQAALRQVLDSLFMFDPALSRDRDLFPEQEQLFLNDPTLKFTHNAQQVNRLLLSDTVDAALAAIAQLRTAIDELLLRSSRSSETLTGQFDALLVNASRVSSVSRNFADSLLVKDAQLMSFDRTIVSAVLFADAVLRGVELVRLSGLEIGDTVEAQKVGEILRGAIDSLLLYDTVKTSPALVGVVDSLLLKDDRLSELVVALRSSLMTGDIRTSALERTTRDGISLGEIQDILKTLGQGVTEQTITDRLALTDALIKLTQTGQAEALLLGEAYGAGKHVARELQDAIELLDRRVMTKDLTVLDALLLREIASRIRELLVRDGALLQESSAAQWFPEVIEFITYARLSTSSILGIKVLAVDLLGRRFSSVDLLGRELMVMRFRFDRIERAFGAGGFSPGFDSGFNV